MINISILNKNNKFVGVETYGHAEYADHGYDIICSAISVIVLNTINSIETFTNDEFQLETREQNGYIYFCLKDSINISKESEILLKSLHLGVTAIEAEYGTEFIKVSFKEV